MKVLFVDDDEESVSDAMDAVRGAADSPDCDYCDFGTADTSLDSFQPDIAVIDLLAGNPPAEKVEGAALCARVWDSRFCPIIVYSAMPEALDDNRYQHHPFVKSVKKGRGSAAQVADAVRAFSEPVGVLAEVRSDLHSQIASALRDTAIQIFETYPDDARSDALRRAVRRRIAARIDDIRSTDKPFAGWEQYVFPPLSADPMLGDILQHVGRNPSDPACFFLILTPSCDLSRAGGRVAKVSKVLVAECCPMADALKRVNLGGTSGSKLKKKLPALLGRGFEGSIIPLPALPGLFPNMAADVRELSLISLEDIGMDSVTPQRSYARVAALDSPFRELIAWAYVNNTGRPGLPDRNFQDWAEAIAALVPAPDGAQTP